MTYLSFIPYTEGLVKLDHSLCSIASRGVIWEYKSLNEALFL